MKIIFFNNGNTVVFNNKGKQLSKLQKSYTNLFALFLKSQNFDPCDFEIVLCDGKKAKYIETNNGYAVKIKGVNNEN